MNLTVFPLILLWTALGIFLFPVGFVIWKIITRWDADRIMRQFVWIYGRGWLLIMAPFVRFKRVGVAAGKFKPPCILVVNHFSFFDTYCMAMLPFSDAAFAIRAWPFKMFWYAPFMHLAGYLNVENMEWRKISETTDNIISKGGALLFFPEGHRSRNRQLQRFYSGAFKLAIETGARVVPVAVQDAESKEVLIIAYANEEALQHTLAQGVATFWSTSRNELWIKGATSGDTLQIEEVRVNCEQNSLLYIVRPQGTGACHTVNAQGQSRASCYYRRLHHGELAFVEGLA